MAGKKLQFNSFENSTQLNPDQLKTVKGGYRRVPSGADSYGLINWGGIDIRNANGTETSSIRHFFNGDKP